MLQLVEERRVRKHGNECNLRTLHGLLMKDHLTTRMRGEGLTVETGHDALRLIILEGACLDHLNELLRRAPVFFAALRTTTNAGVASRIGTSSGKGRWSRFIESNPTQGTDSVRSGSLLIRRFDERIWREAAPWSTEHVCWHAGRSLRKSSKNILRGWKMALQGGLSERSLEGSILSVATSSGLLRTLVVVVLIERTKLALLSALYLPQWKSCL